MSWFGHYPPQLVEHRPARNLQYANSISPFSTNCTNVYLLWVWFLDFWKEKKKIYVENIPYFVIFMITANDTIITNTWFSKMHVDMEKLGRRNQEQNWLLNYQQKIQKYSPALLNMPKCRLQERQSSSRVLRQSKTT